MNNKEFLQYMATQNKVKKGTEVFEKFNTQSQEALKITMELNNRYHTPEEIASSIQPQFSETDTDTITTIIRRYQEQDTWKKDLIFHEDAFDLLQNILEDSDVLKERVPYEKLVTTEFAEKAAAK